MPLGERLRQARERTGITQEAAAAAADVHPQQVSKWERNVHAPGGPALAKLATLYGTTVARLLSEDAESGPEAGPEAGAALDYSDGMLAAAHEMSQTLTLIIARAMAARAGTPQPARAEVDAARGRLRARAAADQDAATEARRG